MKILDSFKDRLGLKPTASPPPSEGPALPINATSQPAVDTISQDAAGPPVDQRKRPFWDGNRQPVFPNLPVTVGVLRRAENPELVTAAEKEMLRELQAEIDKLSRKISRASWIEIRRAAKAERLLMLNKGERHSAGELVRQIAMKNGFAQRRENKKLRQSKIESARKMLLRVSGRVELAARTVLPAFEFESKKKWKGENRLGKSATPWTPDKTVLDTALLCWAPTEMARVWIRGPREFLKQLGISL